MSIKTVPLSKPLTFGKTEITEITLRRPTSGDLRGLKLQGIIDMDVATILTVTSRLSTTPLSPTTLNELDPADLVFLTGEIADFFNPATPSPMTP